MTESTHEILQTKQDLDLLYDVATSIHGLDEILGDVILKIKDVL